MPGVWLRNKPERIDLMKTNTSVKRFEFAGRFLFKPQRLALTIAITAAFATQSAYAGLITTYTLTLTENSATSLSLSYTGPGGSSAFSITNTNPDLWTIQILSQTVSLDNFEKDWAEPEDPTQSFVNVVSHSTALNNVFFVASDLNIVFDSNGATPVNPNNSSVLVGNDGIPEIFMVFNDLAATSEAASVPETGFTLGLFAFALVGLFGIRHLHLSRMA
jgi:hypothetical protein